MMQRAIPLATAGALALALMAGCEDLPGSKGAQGAVIGGAGGAAAGAAIGGDNPLLGALIGGLVGAGGGYLIGTSLEKADADPEDKEAAQEAVREAQQDPATADDVRDATTADINDDGFVTMDEVIAMENAGLTDEEMIRRLRATGQVFELTEEQEQYLMERGISRNVITRMEEIRAEEKEQVIGRRRAGETGRQGAPRGEQEAGGDVEPETQEGGRQLDDVR